MPTIHQSITLNASPDQLFDSFLDSRKHGKIIGLKAKISKKTGAKFSLFDGDLRGRNLLIVPKKLIVQSWRGSDWGKNLDSILILNFSKAGRKGRIDLTHVNVPAKFVRMINKGWNEYYWSPWKKLLARK